MLNPIQDFYFRIKSYWESFRLMRTFTNWIQSFTHVLSPNRTFDPKKPSDHLIQQYMDRKNNWIDELSASWANVPPLNKIIYLASMTLIGAFIGMIWGAPMWFALFTIVTVIITHNGLMSLDKKRHENATFIAQEITILDQALQVQLSLAKKMADACQKATECIEQNGVEVQKLATALQGGGGGIGACIQSVIHGLGFFNQEITKSTQDLIDLRQATTQTGDSVHALHKSQVQFSDAQLQFSLFVKRLPKHPTGEAIIRTDRQIAEQSRLNDAFEAYFI